MAEGKSVDEALKALGEAIKADATKQNEKIEKINTGLSKATDRLYGVATNSYNNTLTLNGFKAGDIVYDVDTNTNKVTPKEATEEDVNNDPLGGKGVVATVVKNKDSIEDLSEDLAKTDNKVEELAGHVEKNREALNEAAGAVKDLQDGVSDLHEVVYGAEGKPEEGLVDIVTKHNDTIYGTTEDPDSGLVNAVDKHSDAIKANSELLNEAAGAVKDLQDGVSDLHEVVYGAEGKPEEGLVDIVTKQTEAINDLKAYNSLDDVKALVANKADKTDVDANKVEIAKKANASDVYTKTESDSKLNAKADKQALEDLKEEVKDNEEGIGALSGVVDELGKDVGNLTEEHRDLEGKHNKLAEGVKEFTETYNKFTDAVHADLNEKADAEEVGKALDTKANASDVYTKVESNSKLNAKANVADVYSKTETDNKFALKADNSVVSAQAADINNLRTDVNAHKVDINKLRTDVNTHTKRLDHLDNRVNKLDKDLKCGLAAQAALTGLFQPYTVGKANFTAAVGGYKSQTAVAVGTGYRYNQNIATKAGVAFTQSGGVTYNAGVNFEW